LTPTILKERENHMPKIKIKCPNCTEIFYDHKSYANHILKSHTDDPTAVEWANITLHPKEYIKAEEPTYLGKPLDRIPPRRPKDLPKYFQDQLNKPKDVQPE